MSSYEVVGRVVVWAGGGLLALTWLSVAGYFACCWFVKFTRQFWLIVDYHLNRERYREWLNTNPRRDKRAESRPD